MPSHPDLATIEAEIDEAFGRNPLANLPYPQAIWTLLSVVEDHHFKIAVYQPLEENQAAIYVDGLMNAMTYPLRVCYQRATKGAHYFQRKLVDEHYALADEWLSAAEDYAQFCSIFPLYHAGEIDLHIQGNELIPTDWSTNDLSYEAYDRFIAKQDPEQEIAMDPNLIVNELRRSMQVNGSIYSVDFTRRLMTQLESAFGAALNNRYSLPSSWQFSNFTLSQYRKVFACLQSMAYAWFVARELAVTNEVPNLAFASSVWTPRKGLLVSIIGRHTGIGKAVIAKILQYLTFGEIGIRNPDIALQPIIDLGNGQYAISPFVLTNIHAERNLCVLLNQIPVERKCYSMLVDQKEKEVRSEIIASLSGISLDFRHGKIANTDIDLAIIDRKAKVCLCIEIKWFIEPAEIREVLARSEELNKGVTQAQTIALAFSQNDARLMDILNIDQSYDFLSMVGSVNSIGHHRNQHPDVPITKLWHLISELRRLGKLSEALSWLRNRSYLPRKNLDYKVSEFSIQSGKWRSRWYGLAKI